MIRAREDADFRARLAADREVAAHAAGIPLTPTEIALLRAVPAGQIETLGGVTTRRRSLLEAAAKTAVVLGAVGFAACGGARTEMPPTKYELRPPPTEAPEDPARSPTQDAGATPESAPVLQGARK